MIQPTSTSMFDTICGSEAGLVPRNAEPVALDVSADDAVRSLNPLYHLPVVGTAVQKVSGAQVSMPVRVLGATIAGGPLGGLGAAFMGLLEALFGMGPDQSRPATPAGMSQTGSEAGMEPVTPGTLAPGAYTTLATTQPEFLPNSAIAQNGAAVYQQASMEWQRTQMLEKGIM
jgi:hypothetical protein